MVAYMNGYCSARRIPQSSCGGPSPLPMATMVCDPGLARTRDHLLAVGIELLAIEMCVRIDEHDLVLVVGQTACRSAVAAGDAYFSRAPTGTSSKKLASTGLPPSSDAATIIPLDSSPRSLRGADWPRSPLCGQPEFPGHRLRRCPPDLAHFRPNIDFQPQQFVGLRHSLRDFHLPDAQFDFGKIVDRDLSVLEAAAARRRRHGSSVFSSVPEESPSCRLLHAGPLCCSSICCILSMALLSARGNTGYLSQFRAERQLAPFRSVRSNFLMSPRPICCQILAVASGITGCASAVTMRRASALV